MNTELLRKYNVPGPRYTSYPTVPYWEKIPNQDEWKSLVKKVFNETNEKDGVSIYIHVPFCESLCTYCGCNTRITKNHSVENPYVDALLNEWRIYRQIFGTKPNLRELHLGGGTPTFLSADSLKKLVEGVLAYSSIPEKHEFGIESHPNIVNEEQLKILFSLGFRRLSLGIQDFDERVQEIINRVQTFESVKRVTETARKIGYTSVNYDLIYGLPLQKKESIILTMEKVNQLRPDRMAFYSYAHVPWMKPGQRKFTEEDLPSAEEKFELYQLGKKLLIENGYYEIGMDHFALPKDDLYQAFMVHRLHRNFMGYTPAHTKLQIGLGVSAISDGWSGYIQNEKTLEGYYERLDRNEIPFFRGHLLTDEDEILRKHILNIMCRFETSWEKEEMQCEAVYDALERLHEIERDGLVEIFPFRLRVTEKGKMFVRNICMAFDARLWRNQPKTEIFSRTI